MSGLYGKGQADFDAANRLATHHFKNLRIQTGDLDGLLGLGLNNLIQILLIISLCRGVLGFPDSLLFGTILPATGISLLLGNLIYAQQARALARREQRNDCTALPYGVNTVSLFAFVFLVMLPAKLAALSAGLSEADAVQRSWQVGLMACLGSGLIETLGAFVAHSLRRWLPRAALLSTLAGIALGYIALGFLLRSFAHPLVCLSSLSVILLGYFGRVRWPIPTGLMALLLGMALAWGSGLNTLDPEGWQRGLRVIGLHWPTLQLNALWQARFELLPWIAVIAPMGLFNLIGSLQNLESAEAAGDRYATRSSLLIDGLGTLSAAALGSCFPTTLYIGHPGFKALGARSAYSWLNGVVMASGCFLGLFGAASELIPVEAGLAILLYIGLTMAAQAFASTPERHGPAVVLGLLPGLAGWGALMLKAGLRAGISIHSRSVERTCVSGRLGPGPLCPGTGADHHRDAPLSLVGVRHRRPLSGLGAVHRHRSRPGLDRSDSCLAVQSRRHRDATGMGQWTGLGGGVCRHDGDCDARPLATTRRQLTLIYRCRSAKTPDPAPLR